MITTGKPQYTHDCDICEFKGSIHLEETQEDVDIYLCTNSMVARYGDMGHEYYSMPISIKDNIKSIDKWRHIIEVIDGN